MSFEAAKMARFLRIVAFVPSDAMNEMAPAVRRAGAIVAATERIRRISIRPARVQNW
jgi:hypothetical protein